MSKKLLDESNKPVEEINKRVLDLNDIIATKNETIKSLQSEGRMNERRLGVEARELRQRLRVSEELQENLKEEKAALQEQAFVMQEAQRHESEKRLGELQNRHSRTTAESDVIIAYLREQVAQANREKDSLATELSTAEQSIAHLSELQGRLNLKLAQLALACGEKVSLQSLVAQQERKLVESREALSQALDNSKAKQSALEENLAKVLREKDSFSSCAGVESESSSGLRNS